MKKAASVQKNKRMAGSMRGMYGSVHGGYYRTPGIMGSAMDRPYAAKQNPDTANPRLFTGPGSWKDSGISASDAVENRLSGMKSGMKGTGTSAAAAIAASATAAAGKLHEGGAVFVNDIVKGRSIQVPAPTALPVPKVKISLRGILLFLLALMTAGIAVVLMFFNFKSATVYGNTKYSQEQIESFITRGRLGDNTFVMALKYHNRIVEDIPFVDRIDVDITSPTTVRVNIQEKPLDGCIFYGGKNVYFSKEGIIETVSGRVAEEATRIEGVVLTHSRMGGQVLAKNQLGLDLSLEVLREMAKYGIHADSIQVDDKSALTVTFGDVDVLIGKTGYAQKMYKMHQILPYLDGKSGVISMTRFESDYSDKDIVLSPKAERAVAED